MQLFKQAGTKKCAINSELHKNLKRFGESATLDQERIEEGEKYLVNVYSGNKASVQTFDELRNVEYHRNVSVLLLPPTTHTIVNGHIYRWWYLYKKLSSILNHEYMHGSIQMMTLCSETLKFTSRQNLQDMCM